MFTLIVCGAIFVTVFGLLLYAIIRFRYRPGETDADREPPQIYGSNQIELAWTVIPILIVVVLFLSTVRVIFGIQQAPEPKAGGQCRSDRTSFLVGIPLSPIWSDHCE